MKDASQIKPIVIYGAQYDMNILSMNDSDKVYQNKKKTYKIICKNADLNGPSLKVGTDYEKISI